MAEEEKLSSNEVHCKHCGAIISQSAKTCPKCGGTDPVTLAETIAAGKRGMEAVKKNMEAVKEAQREEKKLWAVGEFRCPRCKEAIKITVETCPHCGLKSPSKTPMKTIIVTVGFTLLGIVCLGIFIGVLITDGWMVAVLGITPLLAGIAGVIFFGVGIFVIGGIIAASVIKRKIKANAMRLKA
jgi:RNA polymerase subunit RPABC4/transcription elongation factor Spt4